MKAILLRAAAAFALFSAAWLAPSPALGDDDMLDMAVSQQNRQATGISSIADTFARIMTFGASKKVVDKIEERDRKQDPFGMAMDPENAIEEPVAAAEEETGEEEPEAVRTSLQEALGKFRVNGIFPARQEIIVGAQNLGVGDAVVIDYQADRFNLVIVRISQDEILMRDTDTGEEAGVPLGFASSMPAGMHRRQPRLAGESAAGADSNTIVPMSRRMVTVD